MLRRLASDRQEKQGKPMKPTVLLIALLSLLTSALPAWSDSESDARNRSTFQVAAVREIANDWVSARLSVVAECKEAAAVADSVNEAMAKAMERAKRDKSVDVRSGAYVTQPVYDDGRVVRWRARQELVLEAEDVDRLAKLIGQLQSESVLLSGIDFSVRRETRSRIENELIKEALSAFRARASLIAEGMGAKDWSLIQLSVGDSNGPPRRVVMQARESMSVSSAASAPPAFDAGTSDLRVQVSGTVELE
jgi:predicted secreted protein